MVESQYSPSGVEAEGSICGNANLVVRDCAEVLNGPKAAITYIGFQRPSRAVDPFVLHLFAALAEKERALISTRTRQALSAAKARGEQWYAQSVPNVLAQA